MAAATPPVLSPAPGASMVESTTAGRGLSMADLELLATQHRQAMRHVADLHGCLAACLQHFPGQDVQDDRQWPAPDHEVGSDPAAGSHTVTASLAGADEVFGKFGDREVTPAGTAAEEGVMASAVALQTESAPDAATQPRPPRSDSHDSDMLDNLVDSNAGAVNKNHVSAHELNKDKQTTPAEKVFNDILPDNRCTALVRSTYEALQTAEEPERSGPLYSIVHNKKFESLCVIVIILNALFTAYVADYEVHHVLDTRALTSFMESAELGFLSFYCLELTLKMIVHRSYFFINEDSKWNNFDLFLVLVSAYEQVGRALLTGENNSTSVAFLRVFRLFKLSKVLRLFRVLRFLTELRLMLNALQQSFIVLFWCLNMLAFILFSVGLVLVQGITAHLLEDGDNMTVKQKDDCFRFFGGVRVTMISLYKASTGGEDWGVVYDIVAQAGSTYALLFLFYTAFFTFAVFNILTGMVVENVVKASASDDELRVLDFRRKRRQYCKDLRHLFEYLDSSHVGTITMEQLQMGMESDTAKSLMERLELDPKDSELFFLMLSTVSDDGKVDTNAFVDGCMHLRGPAAGIDLQCLIFETRIMHRKIRTMMHTIKAEVKGVPSQPALPAVRDARPPPMPQGTPRGAVPRPAPAHRTSDESVSNPVAAADSNAESSVFGV